MKKHYYIVIILVLFLIAVPFYLSKYTSVNVLNIFNQKNLSKSLNQEIESFPYISSEGVLSAVPKTDREFMQVVNAPNYYFVGPEIYTKDGRFIFFEIKKIDCGEFFCSSKQFIIDTKFMKIHKANQIDSPFFNVKPLKDSIVLINDYGLHYSVVDFASRSILQSFDIEEKDINEFFDSFSLYGQNSALYNLGEAWYVHNLKNDKKFEIKNIESDRINEEGLPFEITTDGVAVYYWVSSDPIEFPPNKYKEEKRFHLRVVNVETGIDELVLDHEFKRPISFGWINNDDILFVGVGRFPGEKDQNWESFAVFINKGEILKISDRPISRVWYDPEQSTVWFVDYVSQNSPDNPKSYISVFNKDNSKPTSIELPQKFEYLPSSIRSDLLPVEYGIAVVVHQHGYSNNNIISLLDIRDGTSVTLTQTISRSVTLSDNRKSLQIKNKNGSTSSVSVSTEILASAREKELSQHFVEEKEKGTQQIIDTNLSVAKPNESKPEELLEQAYLEAKEYFAKNGTYRRFCESEDFAIVSSAIEKWSQQFTAPDLSIACNSLNDDRFGIMIKNKTIPNGLCVDVLGKVVVPTEFGSLSRCK